MRGLMNYLRMYYIMQDKILLVHRPTKKSSWANRCMLYDEKFDSKTAYNHRSMLINELVIEYDEDDKELNRKLADRVHLKLREDGVEFAKWTSGNKSVHIHAFINPKDARHLSLLKKVFLRYYGTFFVDKNNRIYEEAGEGRTKILPDLRLCSDTHLIRAEYGVHEKTQQHKTLISKTKDYGKLTEIKQEIWEEYVKQITAVTRRKITFDVNQISSLPGFKYIVSSENFRLSDDGRERALFMLIHVLKGKYKDRYDEFVAYLQDWYRYSSGTKLTDEDIRRKVRYHWNRSYVITTNYLNELLESIGREDLIEK